jgi:hypothetical protein
VRIDLCIELSYPPSLHGSHLPWPVEAYAESPQRSIGQVETWRTTILSEAQHLTYAHAALALRYPERKAPITPQRLLAARRPEDRGGDLWTVFNRVQEHLIVGGLSGQLTSGRRTTTRPIAAVSTSMALNRALWTLTANTAQGISLPAEIEVAALS